MKRTKQLLSVTIIAVYMLFVLSPFIQTVAASSNQTSRFKDISDHWAKQSIEKLASLGIIRGYSDGTFRPEKEVTRAQFVAMTVRLLGYEAKETGQTFKDVPKNHWAYPVIQAAIEKKVITKEDFGNTFGPDKPINREEMAFIISRALQLKPENIQSIPFKDKKDIHKNADLVAAAVKAGIIKGHSDQTFGPKENLTRAQASVVLVRMYDYINGVFFKDLDNHWAKDSIQRLVDLGIIKGYEDGTFRPENKVTRAQFVAMVVRMMGYKPQEQAQSFVDVPKSHWAYPIVQAAIENGILIRNEYNQNFEPDKSLTRQEMGMIIARTLRLKPEDPSILSFKDKDKITHGKELLAAVVKARLITGHSDGTFGPNETLTRGQAAVVLSRLYDYAVSAEDPNVPTPSPDRGTVDKIETFDTVKEIKGQIATTLESVENNDSTFVFKGTPSAITTLKPGDIFTLEPSEKYPSGFAEKVVSVTVQDGKTIVRTTDPDITEVFKEIDIQEKKPVSFDDLIPIEIPEGVSLEPLVEDDTELEDSNQYLLAQKKDYLSSSIVQREMVSASKNKKELDITAKDFQLSLRKLKIPVGDHTVEISGAVKFPKTMLNVDLDYRFSKLKSLKTEFITNPEITVTVSAPSSKNQTKENNGITYDGIDLGLDRIELGFKGNVPSWMSKEKSTGPFEKKKLIGKFYVPVYGPAGASMEVFLVVRADLTVGVEVNFVEKIKVDVGIIADKEKVKPIGKIKADNPKFLPTSTIQRSGGIQASTGAGLGMKLAIYKLDLAGLEGELGIKGEAYLRLLILGYGDKPTTDEPESEGIDWANLCYRATLGPYYEANMTIDILKKLRFIEYAKIKLAEGPKDYTFAEASNCEDNMLVATPPVLIVAPGESKEIDLGLYKYDKVELDVIKEKDKLKNDTVSYKISGDQIATVQPASDNDNYKLKVKIDPNAKQGDNAELTVTYQEKEGDKKLTKKIKIIVTTLDQIEVEPSSLSLQSGEQKSLSVKALFKKVNVEGYKEPKGIFERDITDSSDISYKTKDPTIATVNSKGVVTAGTVDQEKSTEIEISYKGITKTVPVTVKPREQASTGGGGTSGEVIDFKQQIKDIILKAEKKADETFRPEAEADNPANFEDLKPLLQDYYTDNYLDSYWKKVYENNIAWFLDPHLLYPLTEATKKQTDYTFTINSQTPTSIAASVKVPLRDNEIPGDSFTYEYKLEKIEDKWLLDDITCLNCERPE
ncbi:S-layer homology domain-containing protein [Parageobacillus toebii]|uniref:SLH domain-containing protein n=1 Tax=Parageobacillus toebii TaxID=153151 RepID=A0A150N3D5_9BACL|nr:S-layer homology domain-containing protein [Parageobacillus toebii]KYD31174.1 hypothetical protein B4110_3685 [Parageobacillus toebii]